MPNKQSATKHYVWLQVKLPQEATCESVKTNGRMTEAHTASMVQMMLTMSHAVSLRVPAEAQAEAQAACSMHSQWMGHTSLVTDTQQSDMLTSA